jgi:CheY-like chemotaxis protein/HPt (histidine-containing phosphotransfer) domain-containing protein
VEDDPINQQVSKHLLSKSGYPVEIAGSGEEALHLLSEKEIDLVLMDIEMPVMNGFKTTNAIRDRTRETINPAIPIVAMTAHATTGYREKCLSANMNEYISKPIDILKLDAIVDQLLTHDSSQQTITELSRSNALDEPIINTRKLNQLREDVEEMFPVIVDKFLGTLPEKLNQLELAVNEANYTRIKDSAHRLRGSCASLYAEKMAGLCQELERLNPTYSQRSITTLLSSLRIEARNVEELLRTTV